MLGPDFLQTTTASTSRWVICHLLKFPWIYYSASRQACGVEVHAYEEALDAVRALAKEDKRVWIDPDRVNYAFANVVSKDRCVVKVLRGIVPKLDMVTLRRKAKCLPLMLLHLPLNSHSLVAKPSPVALAKGIKNDRELEGMRAAHVRDGVAMVLALSRLERDVAAGVELTEVDVDKRITAARARQEKFLGKPINCFT